MPNEQPTHQQAIKSIKPFSRRDKTTKAGLGKSCCKQTRGSEENSYLINKHIMSYHIYIYVCFFFQKFPADPKTN